MATYAVHLNVLANIEADSEEEARRKLFEYGIAHYVDGTDVIVDVEEHAISEIDA